MYVVKWFATHAAYTSNCMVLIGRIQCAVTQFTHAEDGRRVINRDADVSVKCEKPHQKPFVLYLYT